MGAQHRPSGLWPMSLIQLVHTPPARSPFQSPSVPAPAPPGSPGGHPGAPGLPRCFGNQGLWPLFFIYRGLSIALASAKGPTPARLLHRLSEFCLRVVRKIKKKKIIQNETLARPSLNARARNVKGERQLLHICLPKVPKVFRRKKTHFPKL